MVHFKAIRLVGLILGKNKYRETMNMLIKMIPRNCPSKKLFLFFILLVCVCFLEVCQSKFYVPELENLKNQNPTVKKKVIFELYEDGKKSIPSLIYNISDDTEIFNELQNPKYSFFGEVHIYFGIFSAYMIELILGCDSLNKEMFFNNQFLFGSDDNYIYNRGNIFNEDKKAINKNDLLNIKQIYDNWWRKNKHKSIKQLRNDWNSNFRPLSGTKYHWE
jgi:hypothetical protein